MTVWPVPSSCPRSESGLPGSLHQPDEALGSSWSPGGDQGGSGSGPVPPDERPAVRTGDAPRASITRGRGSHGSGWGHPMKGAARLDPEAERAADRGGIYQRATAGASQGDQRSSSAP